MLLPTRGENAAYLIKLSIYSFVYQERVITYWLRQENDINRGLLDSRHSRRNGHQMLINTSVTPNLLKSSGKILLSIKPVRNQKYSNIQIVMCVSLSHQTFNGHYELSQQSKELYKFLSARQIKSYTQTLKKGAEFSGIKTKVYATEINTLFNPSKKSNILFKRTMRSLIL